MPHTDRTTHSNVTSVSPDSAAPTTAPRRRWHAGAIMSTLLAFAFGSFLNVPGEPVLVPQILDGGLGAPHYFFYEQNVVHGWPLRFLQHLGQPVSKSHWGEPLSPWGIGGDPEVTWWKLTANMVAIVLGSLLLGWLVNRHIKKYGYRFTLGNVALFLLAISCVLGYGTYRYRLQQDQLRVIVPPGIATETLYLEWEPFGPYWLRSLTGEKFWEWGDRLMAIEPLHSEDIESFPGKSTVVVMRPRKIDFDDPPSFEGYHRLKAIELYFAEPDGELDSKAEMKLLLREIAKCQTLEGLSFDFYDVKDDDLAELSTMPNLIHLVLSENRNITDAGLVHLASIKSLEELGLQGTGVTQEGVDKLQAELPNCEIFWKGMSDE
ncbi:hypothetical protein [Bremerella sp. P1]|uniref:hypothetical protein n=1 Tax=Bremerella sp. P1 TaxID=3026424 RepID=UPI002368A852|nr:hypothetical protein [Bremerella sp. P1]WDI42394.1 hypothetical protein PSR63_00350 [Bremerella sp. P1]